MRKQITKIFLTLVAFLMLPNFSSAAPSVSGLVGTANHGNSITISGTGFGTGDTTPLLWEQFEDGTSGNVITGSPDIGTWNLHSTNPPVYDSTFSHRGLSSKSAATEFSQFHTDITTSSHSKLYGGFWFRYDMNGQSGCTGIKLAQLWGSCRGGCSGSDCSDYNPGVITGGQTNAAGDWQSYIVTESKTANGGNSCWTTKGVTDYPTEYDPTEQNWHYFELVGHQSAADTADGNVALYIDGNVIFSASNVVTHTLEQFWNQFNFWEGFTGCSGGTEAARNWVDDAYLSDTWARVMLGNYPTWSACTHREMQVASAWADGSITATINQGSFSDGEIAYLYVVDENGEVNETGYPITFGQEYAETPIVSGVIVPDGTISDGNSITISGSGFGDNGPTIEVFDNFESGGNEEAIMAGASATIGQWDSRGSNGTQIYSTDQHISGLKSWRTAIGDQAGGGSGSSPFLRSIIENTDELFISYWTYIPSEDQWTGYGACGQACTTQTCLDSCALDPDYAVNLKEVWVHSGLKGNSCDDCDYLLPLYLNGGDNCRVDHGNCVIDGDTHPTQGINKGEWKLVQAYLKGAHDATGTIWSASIQKNGTKKYTVDADYTNVITMGACDETGYTRVDFLGYAHTTVGSNTRVYLDDCYLAVGSGARARIMIGDEAALADCTDLAISTPIAWSDSSITATVRQGSFTDGETAHLYVVDENGEVNETGYPITFGTSGGDTTAPSSPSGLSVS